MHLHLAINKEVLMSPAASNNGWLRALGAVIALITIARFLNDLEQGRLNWRLS